jgi:hypothetical protein
MAAFSSAETLRSRKALEEGEVAAKEARGRRRARRRKRRTERCAREVPG